MIFLTNTQEKPGNHRSQDSYLLAPLILIFLLVLPNIAFGAELFPPFNQPFNNRTQYNYTTDFNFSTQVPLCCPELTTKVCYDPNTLLLTTTGAMAKFAGITPDGNITYSIFDETSAFLKTCVDGCSFTLNDCRPSIPFQFLELVVLLVFLGIVAYFAYELGIIGILAGATAWIMTLYMASWDAFSEPMLTIVRILPLLYLLFLVFTWRFKADLSKNDNDDD